MRLQINFIKIRKSKVRMRAIQMLGVTMNLSDYVVVGEFSNDGTSEMCIFLELTCEEVYLSPGHKIQLLAKPSEGLLPISIGYSEKGLQIYPNREFDPDWHIRFKDIVIKAGYPTRVADLEAQYDINT